MTTLPLSVYVHLPWCESKCPYCDFNSHKQPADSAAVQADYVDALVADLMQQARWVDDRPVETVFIGGGTPSLFPPDRIATVLQALKDALSIRSDAEITMEANPGSLERGHYAGYRDAGVNRLSIGGQSMNDQFLKRLGRLHSANDTVRAVEQATAAGFERINVDLMYGLPEQRVEEAIADVAAVLALGVRHVSHYQLTLEPNTQFFARPPNLPADDHIAEMMDQTALLFTAAGLSRYEISALATPGEACRHNLNYWRFGDYLGLGAGAHGKLTLDGVVHRYARPAHPQSFIKHADEPWSLNDQSRVSDQHLVFEFMMNALRLTDGFDELVFEQATGLKISAAAPSMEDAVNRRLLQCSESGIWSPTALGRRFLNDLIGIFLPG